MCAAYSKRDYEMVAANLRAEIEANDMPDNLAAMARETVRNLAQRFADRFERDNPRFNRTQFLNASGCL